MSAKVKNVLPVFIVFVLSIIFCYIVNKNINVRSLYMDDLSDYYHFIRDNFFHYSFIPIEGQHYYRPVFNASLYLIFSLITKHIWRILIINIFTQGIIATTIYIITTKLGINKLLAVFCSYMYILSHFSCFQMGQCIGVLESEAIFLSIILFFLCVSLFNNIDTKYEKFAKRLIYIVFFILVFTHERFISNVLMIIVTFFMIGYLKNDKLGIIKNISAIFIELILIFGIRFLMIKKIVPTGTGRTDVIESFDIMQSISYMFSQILYVLGINDGPEHLCGINFKDVTPYIRNIVYISIFMLLIIIVCHFIYKIKNINKNFKSIIKNFSFDILVFVYMAGCIAASSVTIRLEMRWVYSTFLIFIIYIAYIINDIKYVWRYVCVFSLIVFILLRTNIELFYRSYNYMIYFMNDLMLTNDLADQTIYKYGIDGMKDRKVYILYNRFNLSGRCIYYFYEPFTGEVNSDDHVVLNMIEDFDPNDQEFKEFINDRHNLVFLEDYEKHAYIRVNPD